MKIFLSYLGELQTLTHRKREIIAVQDRATLGELVGTLKTTYGNDFYRQVSQENRYVILINGQNHKALEGNQTVLKEGDMVVFMRITMGG